MKRHHLGALALSTGAFLLGTAHRAAASSRLTLGSDWSWSWLADTRRATRHGPDNLNRKGNYLGSLWGLDARQHAFPDPFVEYRVVSWFGFGAGYGQVRAKTLDWTDDSRTATIGDGDVEIRGLRTYAFGQWHNRSRFTPYANLGLSHYWARFLVLPSWTRGDPGRVIQVKGTHGWFFVLGVCVSFRAHLEGSVFYQHSSIGNVAARAYGDIIDTPNRYTRGSFPMRNGAIGFGLEYRF